MHKEHADSSRDPGGMLQPYRALDLTDDKGYLCGKILADLGADVIKIEKPGGDPGRAIGPFYKDVVDPEKSLYWYAFNINKRGVTLNIESSDGQALFKRLLKTADIVIESFPPGYLDSLELGYAALSQINPRVILTSITPFGQAGPYTDYAASDIVVEAMAGHVYVSGDPDRPPIRLGFPQSCLFGGAEAAVGTMIALNYLRATGEGQHVDISMQRSVFATTFDIIPWWTAGKIVQKRQGSLRIRPDTGTVSHQLWQCKDGYISFSLFGGPWSAGANKLLAQQLEKEGLASDYIRSINWEKLDWAKVNQTDMDEIQKPFEEFFLKHTKKELFESALKAQIMLCPVSTTADLTDYEQLKARQYWVDVEHDEIGTAITYPGPWVRATETPVNVKRRAPTIGEHNREIYGQELGLSTQELEILKGIGAI